jgi:hypothetical protein
MADPITHKIEVLSAVSSQFDEDILEVENHGAENYIDQNGWDDNKDDQDGWNEGKDDQDGWDEGKDDNNDWDEDNQEANGGDNFQDGDGQNSWSSEPGKV